MSELKMSPNDVEAKLITHAIENECNLGNERKHFEKKIVFVELLTKIYNSPLHIEQGIPTESNANYKITNKILERFCVQSLDEKFEKPLNRLVFFRNSIAHGENSIKVTNNDVIEFTLLIENLMFEILISIEKCINNDCYKQ